MMPLAPLAGLVGTTLLGYTGLTLLPLLVGAGATEYGLDEGQQAILATADVAGLALGAVLGYAGIGRIGIPALLRGALALLTAGTLLAPLTSGFAALCMARFGLETGAGLVTALMFVLVGQAFESLRVFAICTAAVMAQSLMIFVVLPPLLDAHGPLAVHLTQLLALVALGPLALLVPRSAPLPRSAAGVMAAPVLRVLAALACFWAAEGVLWAFMERLGVASGLSSIETGQVMALAMLASLAGAVLAAWIAAHSGRYLPVLAGITAFAGACAVFLPLTPLAFAVALAASQFCFSFVLPYLLEMCAECDGQGRSVALTPAVNNLGQALGPLAAAPLLAAAGYAGVVWVAVPMLAVSGSLAVPLARFIDRGSGPEVHAKV